jgi:hypothetical protein
MGGVEVILRVREAKTKKCAILWALNVTVVSAQPGTDSKSMVTQIHEKVILLSVTEYINSSRGAGKGVSLFGFTSSCRAAYFLRKGLGFGPQRLSSGPGLLVC